MVSRLLLLMMLPAFVPLIPAQQDNSDAGINLKPTLVLDSGPWQFGYLGCSHTSFNLDCRVTAINTGTSPEYVRFIWKTSPSQRQTQIEPSKWSHITDPHEKSYYFGHLWAYTDIHKKGIEDHGSAIFSAAPKQRLYFQIIIYGVPDDIIEMPSLSLVGELRKTKDQPGIINTLNFQNVPIVGLNEDPDSKKNLFYRRFPYLRRWGITAYELVAVGAFLWHIRNPRFLSKTLTSYVLNTIFLCLLVYSSAYLMYQHPESWQHGYEFSILPVTMSNGPRQAGEITKGTHLYWGLLVIAVSLTVSFPQSVLYALGAPSVTDSAIKRLFYRLARALGYGVCFIAVITTLSSTLNPYRSSKWLLMLVCSAALYGINRSIVAVDLHQSINNYLPGGEKSLGILACVIKWLYKIGFF